MHINLSDMGPQV